MHNYNIKYNVEFFIIEKYRKFPVAFRKTNVWKIGTRFGTFARQVETLARRMARWQVYWQVGT